MSRHAGRNSRVYQALLSGGTAEPMSFISGFSINFSVDSLDVTAYGDSNKVYVPGLPDASGDYTGFYDDATVATYTAAIDGVARKTYLYPDIVANPTQYWYGLTFPDFKIDGTVEGAIALSSSWKAGGPITKNG